jgi:eukaryotic-like serine/threonine-protein kinase
MDDGNVAGDFVSGDKIVTTTAGGDIVGGHKVTQTGTGNIFTGSGDVLVIQPQLSPASARERAALLQLLKKVKTFWIEGVLERSVYRAYLLELGLDRRTAAIEHPWASVLEVPEAGPQTLPPGTPISQVFEDAQRGLLILGAPGSGKTTTLLELARELIARAEADPAQPIPVVFNLSGWRQHHTQLGTWLASELAVKYQVPTRLGSAWLSDQRLLPLLDGLDEVDALWQAACVKAINAYPAEQGLPGLVVCSRLEEYTQLPVRLRLNAAVCLSPLAPAQIDAYLQAGGERLAALRSVLAADEGLATLAQTPLFLSIMSLAYQEQPPETPAAGQHLSLEERRQHLFGRYVERMLKRKGQAPQRMPDSELLRWVGWLARQMAAHRQSVFLVERMQPSWIGTQAGRWIYALASRLAGWTVLGLILALALVSIAVTLEPVGATPADYAAALLEPQTLRAMLDLSLSRAGRLMLAGVIAGLISGARFAWHARRGTQTGGAPRPAAASVVNVLAASVVPLLVVQAPALLRGLLVGGAWRTSVQTTALGDALALLLATIALRAWDRGGNPARDITLVDALNWSWPQSLRGALAGFGAGSLLAALCALTFVPGAPGLGWLVGVLLAALTPGLLAGAALGLISGLRSRTIAGTAASSQWVRRQARNALAAGLAIGLGWGLCGGITMVSPVILALLAQAEIWRDLVTGAGFGLACGLATGVVGALCYGGFGLIQHVCVRVVLIAQHQIPWRLGGLAHQAEDVGFLRRVGGGYIFIHRLLLEYFAGLPPVPAARSAK